MRVYYKGLLFGVVLYFGVAFWNAFQFVRSLTAGCYEGIIRDPFAQGCLAVLVRGFRVDGDLEVRGCDKCCSRAFMGTFTYVRPDAKP